MSSEDLVLQWLNDADDDSPAGALFISGEYAAGDVTAETTTMTFGGCGSVCTGSANGWCC